MTGLIIGASMGFLLAVIISIYEPHFDVVQDIDLDKVLIMWYNKYTSDGSIIREHKILYDTGRNKR